MTPYFTYKNSENIIPHAPGFRTSMLVYNENENIKHIVGIENGKFQCQANKVYNSLRNENKVEFVECGPTSEFLGYVSEKITVRTSDEGLTHQDNYKTYDIYIKNVNGAYEFTRSPKTLGKCIGTGVYKHDQKCFDVFHPNKLFLTYS